MRFELAVSELQINNKEQSDATINKAMQQSTIFLILTKAK
jgi:hypothetical protein